MAKFSSDFSDVKDDAKDRLSSDFEQLKQNFSQLKDDVGSILKNTLGVGRSNAHAAKDEAASHASAYYGRAKDKFDDYRDRGTHQVENIGEQIGDHPVAAAAIAFGVGFVIAKLLTKR